MLWKNLLQKEDELAGFAFGLTSGIVTTLGVLVGVSFATQSKLAVVAAVATVAVADAFSDAFGIHTSKEAENRIGQKGVWSATVATFWSKLIVGLLFILLILSLPLPVALVTSLITGLFNVTEPSISLIFISPNSELLSLLELIVPNKQLLTLLL